MKRKHRRALGRFLSSIVQNTPKHTCALLGYFFKKQNLFFCELGLQEGRKRVTGGLLCRKISCMPKIARADVVATFRLRSGHRPVRCNPDLGRCNPDLGFLAQKALEGKRYITSGLAIGTCEGVRASISTTLSKLNEVDAPKGYIVVKDV